MQNIDFDAFKIKTIVELMEKYGLEGRYMLGKPDDSWSGTIIQLFCVPMGPASEAWMIPVAANAEEHVGLTAKSLIEPDGIHVSMEYDTMHRRMPAHSVSFKYDCLVAIQIRGLKRNRMPKCITITCSEDNWESRLDKELSKLVRVVDKQAAHVQWNHIEDQITF